MTGSLRVSNLSCGYGTHVVLSGIDFSVDAGQTLCLLGPNGVGKTTLFKTLLGFLPAIEGKIFVDEKPTDSWSRKDFAQSVAYIPQTHSPSFSFSVAEIVLMGRTPYLGGMSNPGPKDEEIAARAMEDMKVAHLAQRDYASLSGGERQMVLIARALAAQPKILVMDEPCANLDFGNQVLLLEQILRLTQQGLSVVMTTHDPNHALMLEGCVLCLGRDGVVASGSARDVLQPACMRELYGVPVRFDEQGTMCAPVINSQVHCDLREV